MANGRTERRVAPAERWMGWLFVPLMLALPATAIGVIASVLYRCFGSAWPLPSPVSWALVILIAALAVAFFIFQTGHDAMDVIVNSAILLILIAVIGPGLLRARAEGQRRRSQERTRIQQTRPAAITPNAR